MPTPNLPRSCFACNKAEIYEAEFEWLACFCKHTNTRTDLKYNDCPDFEPPEGLKEDYKDVTDTQIH